MLDGLGSFRSVRTLRVPRMGYVGIVKRNEVRSLFSRKLQPGDDLVDSLLVWKLVVERQIVAGPFALYLRFRTRPEKACCTHSLLFREHPKRRTSIPASIRY